MYKELVGLLLFTVVMLYLLLRANRQRKIDNFDFSPEAYKKILYPDN
jgi:hypothetical protein